MVLLCFFIKLRNRVCTLYTGGPQVLPHHLSGFHHYGGLYSEMYGHHQQGPVTAPPSVAAPPRGFFTPDLPASHHPGLPRIDNTVLTYLNDATPSSSNGQSAACKSNTKSNRTLVTPYYGMNPLLEHSVMVMASDSKGIIQLYSPTHEP